MVHTIHLDRQDDFQKKGVQAKNENPWPQIAFCVSLRPSPPAQSCFLTFHQYVHRHITDLYISVEILWRKKIGGSLLVLGKAEKTRTTGRLPLNLERYSLLSCSQVWPVFHCISLFSRGFLLVAPAVVVVVDVYVDVSYNNAMAMKGK